MTAQNSDAGIDRSSNEGAEFTSGRPSIQRDAELSNLVEGWMCSFSLPASRSGIVYA